MYEYLIQGRKAGSEVKYLAQFNEKQTSESLQGNYDSFVGDGFQLYILAETQKGIKPNGNLPYWRLI